MRAVIVLVLVGLTACGDDGGGSVSLDDAADVFHAEYCRYLARCGDVPDEATCAGMNLGISNNVDPSLRAAIDAGKVKYNGANLGRCYHAIGDMSCDRTDGSVRSFGGDACSETVIGTVADSGQCALDAECISQTCDVPACPDQCCQGTCAATAAGPGDIGAACELNQDCKEGAYCDSTTDLCAALKPAGSACQQLTECAYNLGCAGTPRTCQALPTLGQACPDGMCRDAGTYCTAAKVCAKVGLPGDPCTTRSDCSFYYVCDATNHCAVGPHEGESCAVNTRCADFENFCDSATKICKGRQPDGAACTTSSQCDSNFCAGTTGAMTCQVEPICI
jgi:hypothetical protein